MANKQRLALFLLISILIVLSMIPLSKAYLGRDVDRDRDGVADTNDPNPEKSGPFDWFGIVGPYEKDIIFGIILWIVLFAVFTMMAQGFLGKLGGHTMSYGGGKEVVYVFAGALAAGATYFSYGTGVWAWYIGLFRIGPWMLLIMGIIIFAIMAYGVFAKHAAGAREGLTAWHTAREAGQGVYTSMKKALAETAATSKEIIAEENALNRMAWEVQRFRTIAMPMEKRLEKLKSMLIWATEAPRGEAYAQTMLNEARAELKLAETIRHGIRNVRAWLNRLRAYDVDELKKAVKIEKEEVKVEVEEKEIISAIAKMKKEAKTAFANSAKVAEELKKKVEPILKQKGILEVKLAKFEKFSEELITKLQAELKAVAGHITAKTYHEALGNVNAAISLVMNYEKESANITSLINKVKWEDMETLKILKDAEKLEEFTEREAKDEWSKIMGK